ncbi:MAG: hypothetical protein P8I55_01725 [Crocinitomix sp.]|nr:hypothetical protein [Crocinitomix sp.]
MKALLVLVSLSVFNLNAQFSGWWRKEVSDFELTGPVKTMSQKAYYKYRGKKKVKQLIKNPDHIDYDHNSVYHNRETEFSPTDKTVKDTYFEARSYGMSGNSEGIVKYDLECNYNKNDDWFYFIGHDTEGYDRVVANIDSALYNQNGDVIEQKGYWYGELTWSIF